MVALIGIGVGPRGRAQQRKPQHIAHHVVAVLVLVENAEAVDFSVQAGAREVGPAHGRNLELGILPAIVARGGPLDGSVGNLVRRKVAGDAERKRGFEQYVLFVPVDVVFDVYLVAVETDGLDEL